MITPLNTAEQELLDYAKQIVDPMLYPKCEGFLRKFIHSVRRSGMLEAAALPTKDALMSIQMNIPLPVVDSGRLLIVTKHEPQTKALVQPY